MTRSLDKRTVVVANLLYQGTAEPPSNSEKWWYCGMLLQLILHIFCGQLYRGTKSVASDNVQLHSLCRLAMIQSRTVTQNNKSFINLALVDSGTGLEPTVAAALLLDIYM